jgi:thiol-disulfide isomerase/thioredoxin
MRKIILFVGACLGALAVQAQDASGKVIVFSGTAGSQYEGEKVVLYNHVTNDHDSAYVKNGRFVFTVPFKEPSRYMFYSEYERRKKHGYSPFGILVTEPAEITIDADLENFPASKISGSKENDLYNGFGEEVGKIRQKTRDQLTQKYGEAFMKKPDTSDARYKPMLKYYDSLKVPARVEELARLKEFISQYPASFSAVYVLDLNSGGMDLKELQTLYDMLSPVYKDSRNGKHLAATLDGNQVTGVGKIAPDFSQPDTLGRMVKLSDFRGKYVLIDFWASWCGPCRAENPNVVKAYNEYKDKGFTVLGVSLDQPGKRDAWLSAIRHDGLAWTQVSDLKFWNNAVALLYNISAIPVNLLLDPQGKIIAKNLRGEALRSMLNEVLTQRGFTLTGNIKGEDSGEIRLYYKAVNGELVKDSTMIRDGHFTFSGRISEPVAATLEGDVKPGNPNGSDRVAFYLDPAGMTIDLQAGDFKDAVITGAPTEDDFRALRALKQPIFKEQEPMAQVARQAYQVYLNAVKAKADDATLDSLKYKAASLHDRLRPYQARATQIDYAFFTAHPGSYITALYLALHVHELSVDSLQMFYDRLGTVMKQSVPGKKIGKELDSLKAGSPGSKATDFTARDINGNNVTLSAFKGKYVLIDFWASWCVPCRKSMPHVKELYAVYKPKGLEVIGVSDDDRDTTAWKKAVAKDGTGIWHNVLRGLDWAKFEKKEKSGNDISFRFGVVSLPTKILIDPNGEIIGRYDNGTDEEEAAMDKKLKDVLGN